MIVVIRNFQRILRLLYSGDIITFRSEIHVFHRVLKIDKAKIVKLPKIDNCIIR